MTPKEALLANLERVRDAIDRERQLRGLIQMGIKRPKLLSPELEEADGHIRFIIDQQIHTVNVSAAKAPKLSVRTHWLLRHLAKEGLVCATVALPCHWSQKPDMGTMRGLIRRGWAAETYSHLFAITASGRAAAALVGPCPGHQKNLDQS